MAISSICTLFGCRKATTPQQRVDQELFWPHQLSKVQKIANRLLPSENLFYTEALLNYITKGTLAVLIPSYFHPILGTLGALAFTYHLYNSNPTSGKYYLLPNTIDHGLDLLESAIIIDGGIAQELPMLPLGMAYNRPGIQLTQKELFYHLCNLENQFNRIPEQERTQRQQFRLGALRDLITRADPTPRSRIIFQKKLLCDLIQQRTPEVEARFAKLKEVYANFPDSPVIRTIQHVIDHGDAPFVYAGVGIEARIPDLNVENFPCYLHQFLRHLRSQPIPQLHSNYEINVRYAIRNQLSNFYNSLIQEPFYGNKSLFDAIFLSMGNRILEQSALLPAEPENGEGDFVEEVVPLEALQPDVDPEVEA